MKNYFLLFCITLSYFGFAQELARTDQYEFGKWNSGDGIAYVFADFCNVRKNADPNSEAFDKLQIGTKIKILNISTITHTQHGVTAPWVEIKTLKGIGYVWGGALTNGILQLNKEEFAVWGIIKTPTEEQRQSENPSESDLKTYASVRIATKAGLKTQCDFEVRYGDMPTYGYITLQKNPIIDGKPLLIKF